MKRFITIITAALLTLIIGAFMLIPLHALAWGIFDLESGHDDGATMFDFLLFIEWPILLIIGSFIGESIYKKYLTNKVRS